MQPVYTLVATPSPKKQIMSKIWQFFSEEQGNFHQNFELVSSFCNFLPKNNDCLLGLDYREGSPREFFIQVTSRGHVPLSQV